MGKPIAAIDTIHSEIANKRLKFRGLPRSGQGKSGLEFRSCLDRLRLILRAGYRLEAQPCLDGPARILHVVTAWKPPIHAARQRLYIEVPTRSNSGDNHIDVTRQPRRGSYPVVSIMAQV